jgi:predicted CXXCH cytochrome family protein
MNADSIDQLCLGCHNDEQGIMPVNLATTHPTGVKITYAKVPAQVLKDGKFSCVSCHNPHPSNSNYKYLIVDTADGKNMGTFCAKCHGAQSDPDAVTAAETAPINADAPGAPIIRVNSK